MTHVSDDERVREAWRSHRPYLVDLAFRMLADIGAAEDVVQEAFSRLLRATTDEIEDERGWLIVVTSRLCLDHIKSARSRRERAEDSADLDRRTSATSVDPADRVTLDDNIRLALIVVLERLTPAERVVFVLHDVFQNRFDVIAETVGRTSSSCRQLARRARQKIEAGKPAGPLDIDASRYQEVTEKFIAACSNGQMQGLLAVLDPDVAGTIDTREAVRVVGAEKVADNLLRFWGQPTTTLVSQPVGGQPALLGFSNRELAGVLLLTVEEGLIKKIHVLTDPVELDFVRYQLSPLAAVQLPEGHRQKEVDHG
jgi:RNA polymerase sigma-70 factor (ECF subfamily)